MLRSTSRLRRKFISAVLVLAGAGCIALVIGVLLYHMRRYVPDPARRLFDALSSGSWDSGVEGIVAVFDGMGPQRETVFLAVQVLQSFLAPIPGQLTCAVGGLAFGFWYGLGLSMLGMTIGSTVALIGVRALGRPLISKLVPRKFLRQFDFLMNENGLAVFWVIFLLPALPDDSVCLMAGLTRIPVWRILLAATLGRLPGTASVVLAGAAAETHPLWTQVMLTMGILLTLFAWIFDSEVKSFLKRCSAGRGARRSVLPTLDTQE